MTEIKTEILPTTDPAYRMDFDYENYRLLDSLTELYPALLALSNKEHLKLVDFGIGAGNGTKATIERVFPNVNEVVGIDPDTRVSKDNLSVLQTPKRRFSNHKTTAQEFLRSGDQRFEVALIYANPELKLSKEEMKLLADSLSDDGVVISTMDTACDGGSLAKIVDRNKGMLWEWEQYFQRVEGPERSIIRVWEKIDTSKS